MTKVFLMNLIIFGILLGLLISAKAALNNNIDAVTTGSCTVLNIQSFQKEMYGQVPNNSMLPESRHPVCKVETSKINKN